jgi:hypothetical protein
VNQKGDHKMWGLRAWFLRHSFAAIFLATGAGSGICCGKEEKNIDAEAFLMAAERDFEKRVAISRCHALEKG